MLITYGATIKKLRTAINLLDTDAGVNLVHPSLITTAWKLCILRYEFSRVRTATRKLLQLDRSIPSHPLLGDLCTRVWFGIALHLDVVILLGTKFIDPYIRYPQIFPN